MVSHDDLSEPTSRRTYLRTAGTAAGAIALASGTAVAGCDDKEKGVEGVTDVPEAVDQPEEEISEPTVITEPGNYTLTDDITVRSGNGIIIASDNVSLSGGGNTITGKGSGTGIFATLSTNIFVEDMIISDFDRGIFYFEVFDSVIGEVTVNDCPNDGIFLDDAARNTIRDCELNNCGLAFSDDGFRNTVIDSEICNAPEAGIGHADAPQNIFARNIVSKSGGSGFLTEFDGDHILARNEFTNNEKFGVDLQNTTNNLVADNNLSDNEQGPCNVENVDENVLLGNDPECNPDD